MRTLRTLVPGPRAELGGDEGLATAAAFAVVPALALAPGSGSHASNGLEALTTGVPNC